MDPQEPTRVSTPPIAGQDDTRSTAEAITVGSTDQPAAEGFEVGARLGRYVLLERVGSGGMGVVYAAYDPELDRRVALKLLRSEGEGSQPTGEGRARLLREAQAMAKLSHPNVITVYDVGALGATVFVAMEFVEGQTLTRWLIEEARPWRTVIDVFARAGRGLGAAHAAGLVHRDFKPDNVLVGRDGRVRVTDFGLARPTLGEEEEPEPSSSSDVNDLLPTSLTRTGALMGTPAYMAPEQHLCQPADTRTDQFSFCVALYEGLYGTRPFGGDDEQALSKSKREGTIEPPSSESKVPAWVRRLVVRGLTADAEERWPSMEALITELEKDPSAQRRKYLTVGGGAVLVVGALVAIEHVRAQQAQICSGGEERLVGVWDEQRKPTVHDALVATGVPYAEPTWSRVEHWVDDYIAAWSGMHREACEATNVRGEQSGELLDLRMACLMQRLAEVDALGQVLIDADPDVVQLAATAAANLSPLTRCADVEALLAQTRLPEDPAAAESIESLRRMLAEAKALEEAGRYDKAKEVAQGAVDGAKEVDYAPVLAEALERLASLQDRLGDYENAEVNMSEAVWKAAGANHDEVAARAASRLIYISGVRHAKHDDALLWARHAEAAVKRVGTGGREESALHNALGGLYSARGKFDDARQHYEQALTIQAEILPEGHPNVATTLNNLGNTAQNQGRFDDARQRYETALDVQRKALGDEHPKLAMTAANLGSTHYRQGEYDKAAAQYQQALQIYEAAQVEDHPDFAGVLTNIGNVHHVQGDYEQALAYHERALDVWTRVLGPEHPDVAYALNNQGVVFISQERFGDALDAFERSLEIRRKVLGKDHPAVAATLHKIGKVYHRRGRCDRARTYYQQALAMWEKSLGTEHADLADALVELAECNLELGVPRDSEELLDRALEIAKTNGLPPPQTAAAQFTLARVLAETGGDFQRAHQLATTARQVFAERSDILAEELAAVDGWLADN